MLTTNVNVGDTISVGSASANFLDQAVLLQSVTVTANDTSGIAFGAGSKVTGANGVGSAASVDAGASTNVDVTINAQNIGAGVLSGIVSVPVAVNVTNETTVAVDPAASIAVGSGGATLSANDQTNVTTALSLDDPLNIPVANGVFVFSALDSKVTLSRLTSVTVGSSAVTTQPGMSAPYTLDATGGDIALSATSGGTISNAETSTGLGTVEIDAPVSSTTPSYGDTTTVTVQGVNVTATGLSLTATSGTQYSDSGHLSSIDVEGSTAASVDASDFTVGSDGLVVDAQDNSALSASSVAPDFSQSNPTGPIALARTSAENTFDKSITASIDNSTVNSGGVVRVEAVDNASLSTDVTMVSNATTPSDVSISGGGMVAVNLVNGAVSATIDNSTVSAFGDVQVLAGDSSSVTARAETSTIASGNSTSVSVAGTIALNAIGWSFDTGQPGGAGAEAIAGATLGTIVGSNSFWTDNAPSDPTAPGPTRPTSRRASRTPR